MYSLIMWTEIKNFIRKVLSYRLSFFWVYEIGEWPVALGSQENNYIDGIESMHLQISL